MTITCPSCDFSKEIDRALVPKTERFTATCPKCSNSFVITRPSFISLVSNGEVSAGSAPDAPHATPVTEPEAKRHLKIVERGTTPKEQPEEQKRESGQTEKTAQETHHEAVHLHEHGKGGHGNREGCCGNCSGECDGSGKEAEGEGRAAPAQKEVSANAAAGTALNDNDNSGKGGNDAEKTGPTPATAEKKHGEKSGSATGSGSGGSSVRTLSFHGSGRTLLGIYITNLLLTVATLGIYSFWGKAKVRQYLYSGSAFMNERFSYTGTGKELLAGKVRATGLILLLFVPPQALSQFLHPALGLLALPAIILTVPVARTLIMRYRLSRSRWRSIQFSFRGTVAKAVKVYIFGALKAIATLGYCYPGYYIAKQRFWRGNTWYGATPFKYTGRAKDVSKTIMAGSLLTVLTLGIYGFWLSAKLARYNWAQTSYKGLSFNFTATGKEVFKYKVGNALLILFTLGLGLAWVRKRQLDFNFRHIKIEGDIDFAQIARSAERAGATGESLATGLDMDFAI